MREVRIRDTLSGELRTVEAGPGGEVGIYACGPTVYARIHIGNARPFVIFMLLRRFLALWLALVVRCDSNASWITTA
jgi:cysteinyl-tRNA synthetase